MRAHTLALNIAAQLGDRPVVWEPSPKQETFLACPDYEVLYGGAAGGGKSDALLIDAWCLASAGASNKNHRAIIFRRTYPELKDLIARARELYPQFIPGVDYNQQTHIFTAPSGATVEFGYLNNDNDRFKYRGRAWNWIGFDELTLWPTDTCYLYLHTRNRTTDKTLPCYIRATTNPDGPGQKWVMERFGIEIDGGPVRRLTEIEFEEYKGEGHDPYKDSSYQMVKRWIARTFIPAKLTDNRFLRGTGYREILMQLPEEEQDQLLNGRWVGNNVKGAWYVKEMQKMRAENRITRVRHTPGVPVNTYWDLGKNDTTAIWLKQQVSIEHRFIHAYENSGEFIGHYASYLQQKQAEWGMTYGTHFLPHDAQHDLQHGPSLVKQLRDIWPGQVFVVVPRIPRVIDGINMTRAAMTQVLMDERECADGIAALDLYRKKFDKRLGIFTHEPEHDPCSNFADAFRQFGQSSKGNTVASSDPDWKKRLVAAKGKSKSPQAS